MSSVTSKTSHEGFSAGMLTYNRMTGYTYDSAGCPTLSARFSRIGWEPQSMHRSASPIYSADLTKFMRLPVYSASLESVGQPPPQSCGLLGN